MGHNPWITENDVPFTSQSSSRWEKVRDDKDRLKEVQVQSRISDAAKLEDRVRPLEEIIQLALEDRTTTRRLDNYKRFSIISDDLRRIIKVKNRSRRIANRTRYPEDKREANIIKEEVKTQLKQHRSKQARRTGPGLTRAMDASQYPETRQKRDPNNVRCHRLSHTYE